MKALSKLSGKGQVLVMGTAEANLDMVQCMANEDQRNSANDLRTCLPNQQAVGPGSCRWDLAESQFPNLLKRAL